MISSALLLVILTITAFQWSCALMPATSEDGSGVDAADSKVITLQYCIVDNSTILRLDTGDQLDIVYTEDSALVVAMRDSHTTVEIPRLYDEQVCSMDNFPVDNVLPNSTYVILLVWAALLLAITSYNIAIHLLYKKLRNPMGKLLMLYSIFLAMLCVSYLLITTIIFAFPISINHVCHAVKLVYIATYIGYEAIATCILAHSVHHMRQSYKMIPLSPRDNKIVWRRCLCYVIGTIAIAMLVILTYDVGTTEGQYNEYCSKYDPVYVTMVTLKYSFTLINAPIQIAMFMTYLYYWYKMRNSRDLTDYQINQQIFRVAVAMGATISIANFFFIADWINVRKNGSDFSPLVQTIATVMHLLQHYIIVGSLRWVRKVYKAYCKKEPTISE